MLDLTDLEHAIVADDRNFVDVRCLRLPLFDLVLKALKRGERREWRRTGLRGDEMHEAVIGQPQGKIPNSLRRFFAKFLKDARDEALVLFGPVGFCTVSN